MATTGCDVNEMLKENKWTPDFVIDAVHFGRGESHTTTQVKCWRIVDESLEDVSEFYSCETYIIEWKSVKETEKVIYFYWKGEDAAKGYSPLPPEIEEDNPPVERIVQWAEPPAFLQLFSGTFIVHKTSNENPHLYILRGEKEKEIHLYEVELKKESLRSRTSFVLHLPKTKKVLLWHGTRSNSHCRSSAKKATSEIFGPSVDEVDEGAESDEFLKAFEADESEYFVVPDTKIVDYTPRLFYLNKIIGTFSAAEIVSSHKSEFVTPFPFLQSHLYTADQPAIFLLDDYDEIWIWYGWQRDEDDDFKSECFVTAINYAKQKSKDIKSLVKVHKVIAGFEPLSFTNLFPVWKKREDIAKLQEKDGVLPNTNPLIEVISNEDGPNVHF